MELIKRKDNDIWDSFDMLSDLQTDLNRVFNRSLTKRSRWGDGLHPDLDVQEEGDHYRVKADVPGMKKEDFKISIEGGVLTLEGERKEEEKSEKKGRFFSERFYGAFSRSIELPVEIQAEKVKATYKDGVLEITLPKAENAKPRQINVDVK